MNRLEERAIHNGIQMVPLRKTLREMAALLIADGPGSTAGVHDVGVFYAQLMSKRYVIRDGIVYEVPERTVLKLRPAKAATTELDESDDVRLACKHVYTADKDFSFKSTTTAGQFVLQLPSARANEVWKLFRHEFNGRPTYVFAHDSLSQTAMKAIDEPYFDGFDEWQGARLEHSCDAWQSAVNANGYSLSSPTVSAEVSGGGVFGITDLTNGKEALAHFRARALDFS